VTGRFIFASWDGGGNTNPAFNLAKRLMPRGHEVLMLGWPSMATRAADARIPFASYAGITAWPEGNLDDDWEWVAALLGGDDVQADIVRRANDFGADVVVVDCMMSAASRAAHQLGLASSVLCHTLYRPFRDEWGDLVVGDVKAMLDQATQVLIVVPPGLDTPGYLPPGTEYVGSICEPGSPDASRLVDWDLDLLASSDETWVLLSLSTTMMSQTRALGPMLEALGALPVRVLLTLGGAVAREDVSAPDNVLVRDVVPHDFVLPYVDLVLSHGGLSTVTAALSAGKPLVLIPQGRDQSLNAQRVEACGVGLGLDRESTPSVIAEAVTTVLGNPQFVDAARQFSESAVGLGRGELAAQRLEGLLAEP